MLEWREGKKRGDITICRRLDAAINSTQPPTAAAIRGLADYNGRQSAAAVAFEIGRGGWEGRGDGSKRD